MIDKNRIIEEIMDVFSDIRIKLLRTTELDGHEVYKVASILTVAVYLEKIYRGLPDK